MSNVFPIKKFPSLNGIITKLLSSSTTTSSQHLIGLYFCAGWCPDCIRTTPALVDIVTKNKEHQDEIVVDIVYISSDKSEADMEQYKPGIFYEIPFDQTTERRELKQWFHACAMKEMNEVGIDNRKHGIPALILINAINGTVLSEYGIKTIELFMIENDRHEKVLNEWKLLSSTS